jgi:hypothetical protein
MARPSPFLKMEPILLFLVASTKLCSASPARDSARIVPRKARNVIKCNGDLPANFPNGVSKEIYSTESNPLYNLCAAFESQGNNAGCFCPTPDDAPDCRPSLSKNTLIFASFFEFCLERCECSEETQAYPSVEGIFEPYMTNVELAAMWGIGTIFRGQ